MYSQAIAGNEGDATLYGNRSAAYLAQGLLEQALWDARKAVTLRPEWGKGHYRLAAALSALNRWPEAAAALTAGAAADPGNSDMVRRWLDGCSLFPSPSSAFFQIQQRTTPPFLLPRHRRPSWQRRGRRWRRTSRPAARRRGPSAARWWRGCGRRGGRTPASRPSTSSSRA